MRRVRLKEIGTFYSGLSGKSKSDFSEGNALLVTYRNIFNNPVLNPAIKDTVVVGKDEKQNEVLWGDILITGSSETPADAGMSSVVLFNPQEKMYLNSFCFGFRLNDMNEALPSYIGHLLRSTSIRAAISKTAFGVTRFNVNRMRFADIEIPLPPLNIQKEIVSILDSFTSLIDKMKQEVEMRKKQMEYYREKLMAPQKNWEIKTLGEIGTFTRGNGLQKSDFRVKGFPCVHYGQIHTYYNTCIYKTKSFCEEDLAKKLQKASYGDLLIATTSEDVKACCKAAVWFGAGDVAYSGDSFCYSHDQDPKYMAYLFQTEMFAKQKQKAATGAKVIRVSGESMASFSFAFPPLVQQRQIASILDTFETYISKLEKMIELRQKQYEYYREKLLTFE
jgi:type I restriction enzyme, S subunit